MQLATVEKADVEALSPEARQQLLQLLDSLYFRWVCLNDERSCDYCRMMNGNVYRVSEFIPPLPAHPYCRCIYEPMLI
ncbi:MAG: phage minor head protein [Candidatus Bathyarchaeia archaeon]